MRLAIVRLAEHFGAPPLDLLACFNLGNTWAVPPVRNARSIPVRFCYPRPYGLQLFNLAGEK